MTRMSLDINRSDTQHALAHPEVLQQAVEGMFQGIRIPCLWRIENLNHRVYILILSPIRPTPLDAHERYGYPGCFPSWETWDYDGELEHIRAGSRKSFRLDAAVMVDKEHTTPDQLRMAAHMTTPEREKWLRSQEEALGCHFEELLSERNRALFFTENSPDQGLMVNEMACTGLLTVTDPDRFRLTLTEGIGLLKRCGCGLMTVDSPSNWFILT